MNKERLLKVIEAIEKYEGKFSLSSWGHSTDDNSPPQSVPACQTTACAIGSYYLANQKCGLENLSENNASFLPYKEYLSFDWDDVREHFDISINEVYYLFLEKSYPTTTQPHLVINRIRNFIETGEMTENVDFGEN